MTMEVGRIQYKNVYIWLVGWLVDWLGGWVDEKMVAEWVMK